MKEFDITVIGSGPGGYTAAIRAAQLGFNTALVERDRLGGVCLNWGCIPTKALIKSAELAESTKSLKNFGLGIQGDVQIDFPKIISRSRDVAAMSEKGVQFLMKKNKITVIKGTATLNKDKTINVADESGNTIDTIKSAHTIIATGARARTLGNLKFDEEKILSSTGAMTLKNLPKKLVVVGSGAIGMEFAYFYSSLGTEIEIVEMLPQILPVEDKEISDVVAREFKKRGIKIMTATKTEKVEIKNDKVYTTVSGAVNETLESDAVLIAIGITGNIENLGLENLNIKTVKNTISTDKNYKTNVDGIYAIGDCATINGEGKPFLAHTASAEAINCVEKIKGISTQDIIYTNIPGCTYCHPQVASVGLTEAKAKELGYEIKIGKFPFTASGKARAMGETVGMVKLIFDAKYDELIGAHIVGAEATELIGELVTVKNLEGTGKSIIQTIHPHPTLSEAIMEAAGVAYNEAINI